MTSTTVQPYSVTLPSLIAGLANLATRFAGYRTKRLLATLSDAQRHDIGLETTDQQARNAVDARTMIDLMSAR
ncbi:MAG: hypothetical protein ACTSYE_06595 [Alphaproteobacteria bacterium]